MRTRGLVHQESTIVMAMPALIYLEEMKTIWRMNLQQPCRIESALSHYHYALANGMKDPKSLAWACEALRLYTDRDMLDVFVYATYF